MLWAHEGSGQQPQTNQSDSKLEKVDKKKVTKMNAQALNVQSCLTKATMLL